MKFITYILKLFNLVDEQQVTTEVNPEVTKFFEKYKNKIAYNIAKNGQSEEYRSKYSEYADMLTQDQKYLLADPLEGDLDIRQPVFIIVDLIKEDFQRFEKIVQKEEKNFTLRDTVLNIDINFHRTTDRIFYGYVDTDGIYTNRELDTILDAYNQRVFKHKGKIAVEKRQQLVQLYQGEQTNG